MTLNVTSEMFAYNYSDTENTTDTCDDHCKDRVWSFWIEGVAVPGIALFGIFGELRFRINLTLTLASSKVSPCEWHIKLFSSLSMRRLAIHEPLAP